MLKYYDIYIFWNNYIWNLSTNIGTDWYYSFKRKGGLMTIERVNKLEIILCLFTLNKVSQSVTCAGSPRCTVNSPGLVLLQLDIPVGHRTDWICWTDKYLLRLCSLSTPRYTYIKDFSSLRYTMEQTDTRNLTRCQNSLEAAGVSLKKIWTFPTNQRPLKIQIGESFIIKIF